MEPGNPTQTKKGTVCVVVPAQEEFVGIARIVVASVASAAGLADEDVADLKVAVSEACTNVIRHAYDLEHTDSDRTIEVKVGRLDEGVEVDVSDKGGGVSSQAIKCTPKVDDDEGGFGLTLIGSLMDTLELTGNGTVGTSLKFSKRISKRKS